MAECREFAKVLRSLEQFIQTVKGQKMFWKQNSFFTCFWRFLGSNKLEQLEFKMEKNIGIEKHAGKAIKKAMLALGSTIKDYMA